MTLKPYAVETLPGTFMEASPNAVVARARSASGGKTYTFAFLKKQDDIFLSSMGILRISNQSPPAPSDPLSIVDVGEIVKAGDVGHARWQESEMELEPARHSVISSIRKKASHERSKPIVVTDYEFDRDDTEAQVRSVGAALGAGNAYPAPSIQFDAIMRQSRERVRLPVDESQFKILSNMYANDLTRVNNRESELLDAAENAADVSSLRLVLADVDLDW